jgi:chaperonin cofactor prefoldin
MTTNKDWVRDVVITNQDEMIEEVSALLDTKDVLINVLQCALRDATRELEHLQAELVKANGLPI